MGYSLLRCHVARATDDADNASYHRRQTTQHGYESMQMTDCPVVFSSPPAKDDEEDDQETKRTSDPINLAIRHLTKKIKERMEKQLNQGARQAHGEEKRKEACSRNRARS